MIQRPLGIRRQMETGFYLDLERTMAAQKLGITMAAQQQDELMKDLDKLDLEKLRAKIGDQVLHTLGQPGDFQRLQVRRLWKDRYRVNVLLGANFASAKVGYSYFVVADSDGNIIASNPIVTRKYRPLTATGPLPAEIQSEL